MASLEEIRSTRLEKLNLLKERGLLPFPAKSKRTHTISEIREKYDELVAETKEVTISGRIMSLRPQGALVFMNLYDGTGTFQGLLKDENISKEFFELFNNTIDIGDFIDITGTLFTTKRGEETLEIKSWSILTKTLLPLPEKWHGITDPDERYRKRYLDILMDPELRDLFYKKALFWEVTRNFMKEKGFLEVETPTLEVTTGGAEANPFRTHHKDFDIDVYLRISIGELWQKRLMAAGFPKTFEIGRAYRNEGTSPEHLQEFTNMEFYMAYADYKDGMKLTEELYKEIAMRTFGKTEFTAKGHTFDLANKWEVIDYVDHVEKETGINVLTATEEEMKNKLDDLGVVYEGANRERLTDTLWKYCRKSIAGPAFLVHHPKLVSPLAKESTDRPGTVERFQILIAGSEVGNGFSELNDPLDQRERFELQQKLIEGGDSEAMMPEWEFVDMLEHGIPPTCGFGFGERLFAFMVDKPIRETQLFPLMRPKEEGSKKDKETMIAIAIINRGANLESWQVLNTVAHLNAAMGARVGKQELFTKDTIFSKDKVSIKLNPKIAIMLKVSDNSEKISKLSNFAKENGFEVEDFIREMIETTNDKKIFDSVASKNSSDVEYLGTLIYGSKKKVEELTKNFELYK